MSLGDHSSTTSLRTTQLRARLPRFAAFTLIAILCVAGLKAIVKGSPPAAATPAPVSVGGDLGAESFAEAFVRTYLTWTAGDEQARDADLTRYLPTALSPDGGLVPLDGSDQAVPWSAVVGVRAAGAGRFQVTVGAQVTTTVDPQRRDAAPRTTRSAIYLDVPVGRDAHGLLYVMNYPAVVGPPASTRTQQPKVLTPVGDATLTAVVSRALTNYLAGARANLLADLTADAVVSLPTQRLHVTDVGELDWVRTGSRVAVDVDAEGGTAGHWTLRYELDVRRRDRWYVQSLQVDPTFKGARR